MTKTPGRSLLLLLFTMQCASASTPTLPSTLLQLPAFLQQLQSTPHLTGIVPPPVCEIEPSSRPPCASLTDQFCEDLWSDTNQANWANQGSEFHLGKSQKSEISKKSIMNLQALIKGKKNLPQNLQKVLASLFVDLEQHLATEQDSKQWYRDLDLLMNKMSYAVEDESREMVLSKHPELRNKKNSELSIVEQSYFSNNFQNLKNQIVEAKYQHHPNWQKILVLAEQAKEDIIAQVRNFELPEAVRQQMIERVQSVEVVLPYSDPRILADGDACSSTSNNAFYLPVYNRFTVCAGKINGIFSDGSLYKSISHEISHAIDPLIFSELQARQSPMGEILKMMNQAKGPTYSCSEWDKIQKSQLAMPAKLTPSPALSGKISDCLVDKSGLDPWDESKIKDIAIMVAKNSVHLWASNNDFSKLIIPQMKKDGTIKDNELYLRPDLMKLKDHNFLDVPYGYDIPIGSIFVQNLTCLGQNPPYTAKAADQAIAQTLKIVHAISAQQLQFCHQECRTLERYNLAKSSSENFADWLSFQAMASHLAKLPSLEQRRQFIAETGATYCMPPGVLKDAPEFTAIEKKYSFEEHGDNRIRRLSVFTDKISELVDCQPTAELAKGFGSCRI